MKPGLINALAPGLPDRQDLDRIQSAILVVNAEIDHTQGAPVPPTEVRARVLNALQRAVFERTPENKWRGFSVADAYEGQLPQEFDFLDFVYIAGLDKVADRVAERLKEFGEESGLPAAERAKRLEKLRDQLEDLEIQEEQEVMRLEDAGHTILRREEIRPELIFKVWAGEIESDQA